MKKPGHLVIGADCGIEIGTGHVMRCLALAQSWKRAGGKTTFLLPAGSSGIEQRIEAEGCLSETLPRERFHEAVVERVLHMRPPVTVLDGYGFGADEQAKLGKAGIGVLIVDDYGHRKEYPAQWILNQNVGASDEMYARRGGSSRLLLGPSYALVRDEFLPWVGWARKTPDKADKILVTIGGSDPENLSLRVIESIAALALSDLQVALVVGGSNPHLVTLQSAVERLPLPIRIVQDARDMPGLMAWADVAVSGAGGTAYELCYMGLPSLLFVIAENQHGVAANLSKLGAATDAGTARDFCSTQFADELRGLIDSRERREEISKQGRELVDGAGAERVRAALSGREVRLRRAGENDCKLLFEWANDSAVRRASFHSEPLHWEHHQQWFSERLRDAQAVLSVGESAGKTVGQVRFQLEDDRATLSVVVAPEFRGAGWGRELIGLSVRQLARTRSVSRVDAFVKPENSASVRLFESTGFRIAGRVRVHDQPALLFTWEPRSERHAN